MKGVFRLKAAFHGTLATQLFDSNNMRDGSRQENSFENYYKLNGKLFPLIQTMGIY